MTLRRGLLLGLACGWMLALHMMLLAGSAPVERRLTVHVATWPAGVPPVRLALVSDTHPSWPGNTPARLRATVARLNAMRPDAVLLAGDYRFDGTAWYRPASAAAIAPLAGLGAVRLAVLGNHDYRDLGAVETALRSAGIRILDNDAVRLGPLALIGISDATTAHDDADRAIARWRAIGGIPLVFTHLPDLIPALPRSIRLVFAGHTHCGQVSLPLIGSLSTGARTGRRYACGVIREGGRTIVVGAGLGTSILPVRLGASPDFWLVTIGR